MHELCPDINAPRSAPLRDIDFSLWIDCTRSNTDQEGASIVPRGSRDCFALYIIGPFLVLFVALFVNLVLQIYLRYKRGFFCLVPFYIEMLFMGVYILN